MTHAEFHRRVGELAGGQPFSAKVETFQPSLGPVRMNWSAYVEDRGWTNGYPTPEAALLALETMVGNHPVPSLGGLGDVAEELGGAS